MFRIQLLGRRAALPLLVLALAACDTNAGADGQIVRYTGPAITEANALVVDDMGLTQRWSADVVATPNGPSVFVSRTVLCGDECGRTITLRFRGGGALPASADGVVRQQEYTPERLEVAQLDIARVEIQDWGPEVYSGVAYPVTSNAPNIDPAPPLVFWTDDIGFAQE